MGKKKKKKNTEKKHLRKLRLIVNIGFFIFVILIGIFILQWLSEGKPRRKGFNAQVIKKSVDVEMVIPQDVKLNIKGYGNVRMKHELNLIPEVSGKVVYVNPKLKKGAYIRKSSILIRIDDRNFEITKSKIENSITQLEIERENIQRQIDYTISRIALAQDSLENDIRNLEIEKSNLKIEKERLKLARREYKRTYDLFHKNQVGTEKDVDVAYESYLMRNSTVEQKRKTIIQQKSSIINQRDKIKQLEDTITQNKINLKEMRTRVKAKELELKEVNLNLDRTRIECPFDAFIDETNVEVSQYVSPGNILAVLLDISVIEVPATVRPEDVVWLDIGDKYSNLNIPANVYNTVTKEEQVFPARITRIENIDEKTRTFNVVAEIRYSSEIKDKLLLLNKGTYCKVVIEGKKVKGKVVIPRRYLRENNTVWVVDDNKLTIRKVEILYDNGSEVFIESGLSEGDLLVVSPLTNPVTGTEVEYDLQIDWEKLDEKQKESLFTSFNFLKSLLKLDINL